MASVPQFGNYNTLDVNSPPAILSALDLIDSMLGHHHDEALALVELVRWHQEQAAALTAERNALATDVDAALAEADRLLQ